MKLLRLYLINCGIHKRVMIDFSKSQDITCIAGVNGSGKTTILDIINNLTSLLNVKQNGFQNYSTTIDFEINNLKRNILGTVEYAQLDFCHEDEEFSVVYGDDRYFKRSNKNPKYIQFNNLKEYFLEMDRLFKTKRNLNNLQVLDPIDIQSMGFLMEKYKKRNDLIGMKSVQMTQYYNKLISQIGLPYTKEQEKLPNIFYLSDENRHIQDVRYQTLSILKDYSYNVVTKYNPSKNDIKLFLISLEYTHQEKYIELINWINKNVLEGKKILEKINRQTFEVIVELDNGERHGLEDLSSGEKSLLIMAFYIKTQLEYNPIFIIDEIDKSLHPEYQEKIITMIKKLANESRSQFIITSHSRFIWQNLEESQIMDLGGARDGK